MLSSVLFCLVVCLSLCKISHTVVDEFLSHFGRVGMEQKEKRRNKGYGFWSYLNPDPGSYPNGRL